jgi:hypothetical protein
LDVRPGAERPGRTTIQAGTGAIRTRTPTMTLHHGKITILRYSG